MRSNVGVIKGRSRIRYLRRHKTEQLIPMEKRRMVEREIKEHKKRLQRIRDM